MYKRIIESRKAVNLTQDAFASKIGLSRSAISNIENGNRAITDRVISDICREFNISEEWLRTGKKPMFSQPDTFSLDAYAKQRGCTDFEIELIKSLMSLSPETRQELVSAFKDTLIRTGSELTATVEVEVEAAATAHESFVSEEMENYRLELEAMQKGTTSSVSGIGKDKIS